MITQFLLSFFPESLQGIVIWFFRFAPIWLPILLSYMFWRLWITYIRRKFIQEQEYELLEIRLPREVEKTPLAMEAFFAGIHLRPGETTWIDRAWLGKVRPSEGKFISIYGRGKAYDDMLKAVSMHNIQILSS